LYIVQRFRKSLQRFEEYVDLSGSSQSVTNVLWSVQCFRKSLQRFKESLQRFLEYVDLSGSGQSVTDILWNVQRFDKLYNDSKNRYNDSLLYYFTL
jgi:hypothetical protein